jgi:hypothetical protein
MAFATRKSILRNGCVHALLELAMWRRCFLGAGAQDFLERKAYSYKSRSDVDFRSERAVHRQLLAISSNRECCSALEGLSNRTSRSILSSLPSLVSHSEPSAAYILECRSQTMTRSSGQFFFAHTSRPSSRCMNPERRATSRKATVRYHWLQRCLAHRLLADAALPQSAARTCRLHPKP